MQLVAIKGLIGEVRLGLRQINTEVVQAAKSRDVEGSGSRHFSEMMAAFHAGAAEEFRQLEVGAAEQDCTSEQPTPARDRATLYHPGTGCRRKRGGRFYVLQCRSHRR